MYEVYQRLRDEKGVSDYRVSEDTGIAKSTFSEWKKGVYSPKLDKIVLLAQYFGVPLETFLKVKA